MSPLLVSPHLAFFLALQWAAGGFSHRPCPPVTANPEPCIKVHGRAFWSNGVGANVWIIGSHRRVALLYDERRFPTFSRYLEDPEGTAVFADFELCPLQLDRPGIMREACLSSISNIVVQEWNEDGSSRVFHVTHCPECSPKAK